jgi:hypothetical protein
MLGMVIHEPLEQLLAFCDDFTHQFQIAKLTKHNISQMRCTPLYADPRVLMQVMQTLELPNNAEVSGP